LMLKRIWSWSWRDHISVKNLIVLMYCSLTSRTA